MADERTLLVLEPSHGVLSVRGPDRKSWLNAVVTSDVAQVTPERGSVGLLLTKQGKIQTDLIVIEGAEQLYLRVARGRSSAIASELDRMLIMEDAELADRSAELAFLSLHGTRAVELARQVRGALAHGSIAETLLSSVSVVVPRADLERVAGELEALGATRDAGAGWLGLRLESAWPEFDVDYGEGDNAHEAALDRRAVSWSKGCYLGQEVVCMQDMRGKVKRRVVPFELDTDETPAAGAAVTNASGEPIGRVTSAAASPARGKVLALGMLKAPNFDANTPIRVGAVEGRVLPLPVAPAGKA